MARSASLTASTSATRLLLGFVAAFLATLTFHQIGIWVLHAVGLTGATPWVTTPIPPLGVPSVLSLAFWGGLWGIVFVLIERWLARCPGGYWVGAVVFGAIVPTLVFWFVVLPLRGAPVGGGFRWPGVLVGPIVDGLWGLGTAVFLGVLTGWRNQPT
ncbi:MAG TPA: hypothetical protein VEK82_01985 [Stellaceae bacterium]|nr:hypothetical protein [Stellaceae bacterium]